ncbi:MAG: acyl-ACP--UDP-N-acetylglucosamine O-acyltransferase [Armatimonadetes bacterium]|nr:acyl-ACP--UDP-N-acetylglucosamine O-acyltransferase [Armatimonadota bacterium]
MVTIHPTALVDPKAELGCDVEVGPFAIIEAGARIGDGCRLGPHVMIHSRVTLGARCSVDYGSVLGGDAQDLKCTTPDTYLELGEDNILREYVTIHRASHEGEATRVGSHNMLMGFVHLGHDVVVGDHTMLANLVAVGGHCLIDDRAIIGGHTALHQKVRIGTMAMVGGMSGVTLDVPPYCLAEGKPAEVRGTNVVGLRRNGVSTEARGQLNRAVRTLYLSRRNRLAALEQVEREPDKSPELEAFLAFVRAVRNGRNGRQLEQ